MGPTVNVNIVMLSNVFVLANSYKLSDNSMITIGGSQLCSYADNLSDGYLVNVSILS